MVISPNTPHRRSKRCVFVCLLLAVMAAGSLTAAEPSKSAFEADPAGWADVMPPADLKGWSRVPVPPGAPLGKPQWRVEDSGKMLVCEGDGGHDMLLCDREFGDAVFHAEFRYTRVEGKTGYYSRRKALIVMIGSLTGQRPNPALYLTRPSRSGCNPRVSRAGSLSLGRSPARMRRDE